MQIMSKITRDYKRGATLIEAKGLFNGSERNIIFVVLNRREITMLKEFIKDVDSKAFMVSLNSSEILGRGFRSLKEKFEK